MYSADMPKRADLPSKGKLIRSTVIAACAAAALLVTVILPAEYGVDPTGMGKVLGLKNMGEIKQQLAQDAEAEETFGAQNASTNIESNPTIQAAPITPPPSLWTDETSVTLKPGAAAEVKLIMTKGGTANYEWTVDKGHLNSDLHTDDVKGEAYSYKQGRAETLNTGDFTAVSDGAHGWYWRNRSPENVTVTLKVNGDYSELKRLF